MLPRSGTAHREQGAVQRQPGSEAYADRPAEVSSLRQVNDRPEAGARLRSPKMFEADRAQRPDFPAETITPAALAAPRRNAPEYLLHCLETGSPIEGFCSPQVGRDTQEIPEAGLRSADTGRTQTLPL